MLASSALLALGVIAFLLVQKYGALGFLVNWLTERNFGGKPFKKIAHRIVEVDNNLVLFYRSRPHDLPLAMLWHALGFACGIAQSWYFIYLLTGRSAWAVAGGIWFLGTWFDFLTFAIPLGIGIQEATRVIALKALGYDMVMGLTFGVTLRLEQLFWAGCGLLCYATLLAEKPKEDPDAAHTDTARLSGNRPLGQAQNEVNP
jgi:hypothetical protein